MIETVIYLLSNSFRIYIYQKLLKSIFKNCRVNGFFEFLGFFFYYLINSLMYILFQNFTINIFTNIIPLLALTYLYESGKSSKIFVSIAFYVVNMMADGIVCIFAFNDQNQVVITSGLATALLTYFIELIYETILKRREQYEIGKTYLLTVLAVPIGSIIIGILTMYNYDYESIVVAALLIIFNILVFYLYDKLQKNIEESYEQKMLKQSINAKNIEIGLMKSSLDSIECLKHDMRNHLITLRKYADDCNYNKLIAYLNSISETVSVHSITIETGNTNVDSIINYKFQEMSDQGININYSISIPEELNILDYDINIVVGNLLNNAIEALNKSDEKEFFIKIYFDKNILFIHMENSFNGNVRKEKGEILTTKQDKQNHGLGLKSIKRVLEKYDGDIIMDYNEEVFITDVMLCNKFVD